MKRLLLLCGDELSPIDSRPWDGKDLWEEQQGNRWEEHLGNANEACVEPAILARCSEEQCVELDDIVGA